MQNFTDEMQEWIENGSPEPVAAEELDDDQLCDYDCGRDADYRVKWERRDGATATNVVCQRCSEENRVYARENDLLDVPMSEA